jgi:hypothetical protein
MTRICFYASVKQGGSVPYFTITFRYSLIVLGFITLTACGVDELALPNSAPVANAGVDQTPLLGEMVTLDGSASTDVDGDQLTYKWSFTSKPSYSMAELSDPASVRPTFVMDLSGDYVVQLIVSDVKTDSTPDTVIISTNNSAPVANAGADQTRLFGDTVILDGRASSDADGDLLTYHWSLIVPADSTATLSDPSAVQPIFDIDVSGNYVASLIVNDGTVDSIADTVTISTSNSKPVANAGANQAPKLGDTVTLDGSASSDVDSDGLTFHWSFLLVPPGSGAKLSDTAAVNPSFTIDVLGDYVVQLIVDDGTVNSSPDTVTVSTN